MTRESLLSHRPALRMRTKTHVERWQPAPCEPVAETDGQELWICTGITNSGVIQPAHAAVDSPSFHAERGNPFYKPQASRFRFGAGAMCSTTGLWCTLLAQALCTRTFDPEVSAVLWRSHLTVVRAARPTVSGGSTTNCLADFVLGTWRIMRGTTTGC